MGSTSVVEPLFFQKLFLQRELPRQPLRQRLFLGGLGVEFAPAVLLLPVVQQTGGDIVPAERAGQPRSLRLITFSSIYLPFER